MTADLVIAGNDVAFGVVFGAFILAFVVLSFITVRWAVRRDRAGRREWLRRRTEAADDGPRANGRSASGRSSDSGAERRGEG